ncbi:MAG: alcohol dehydrogenase catalytic domain-containing protein, partial [Planctomycetaceae bacterium]
MQAIIFERFGAPSEVLSLQDVPQPEPQRDQVRVRMLSSPINPSDLMYVRGDYSVQPTLPATPGFEGVGIVETHGGSLLGRLMLGKRVAVLNRDRGNWSQHTIVPARQVVPIPSGLSADQAAMVFVNPATAWILVRRLLCIPRDAWLLQSAGASALGRMIIRLGQHYGF